MTRGEIYRRVRSCRLATSMANAFRRAFGLPPRLTAPKRGMVVILDAYEDMKRCMANHGSPMDGRP